jgi:F-type H+-transporting ATPase subunit alpha
VISIYAGTRGYFDSVPVNQVQLAEKELLTFMREQFPEVRDKIIATKALEADTEEALKAALNRFKEAFAAAHRAEAAVA